LQVIRTNIGSHADSKQLYDFAIALSNINCNRVIFAKPLLPLTNTYPPKMLFGVFNVCMTFIPLQTACTSRLQMLCQRKCFVTRVKYDKMLIRNGRKIELFLFELPLKIVKNPIVSVSVASYSTSPEFSARYPYLPVSPTLKVHRFRKKIDRGEHQHCRRRGPRNGMLLT